MIKNPLNHRVLYFFIMAQNKNKNKNKNTMNNAKDIASMVGSQYNNIKYQDKMIYGTQELPNIDSVRDAVHSIVSNVNDDMGGNIIEKINTINRELTAGDKRQLEQIKNAIENNKSHTGMQSLLFSMDTRVSKLEDLMIITKIMPQLKDAKKQMVNNILSPDDFTKQISMTMKFSGIDDKDTTFESEMRGILKKYNFTKHVKQIVDKTLTLGTYYRAVIPYSKLYEDLIKNKKKVSLGESVKQKPLLNSEVILSESIKENFEDEKQIQGRLADVYNSAIISEDVSSLFNEELLLNEAAAKNKKVIDLETIKNKIKSNDSHSMSKPNDGLMDTNKEKDLALNIVGAKIKKLDPRRVLKLAIDETVLGYYYIETIESADLIRNPGAFKFRSNISSRSAENSVEDIYRSLGDLLIKKLDKKMAENNSEIKEELYDILKYADAANNRIKVTYIEPQYVKEFQVADGESMFEQSLFYARLYMMLLLSTISAKVARSNDVRAYYVTTDASGGVSNMVTNAINTLRKNNRSFYAMTNLGKMISSFNSFDDLFLTRTKDETKPIDFDIIQGQDVEINTDLLETLEKICVETSGTPLALLQSSSDVDFAKSFSMLNLKFMRTSLDYQIDLNPELEDFAKMILLSEKADADDETKNKIRSLTLSLQSPINLLLTNALEQVNNAKDIAQVIGEVMYGQNPPDNGEMDKFILEVCKKYAPNIPWDEYNEIKKSISLEVAKDKDDTSGEEPDISNM